MAIWFAFVLLVAVVGASPGCAGATAQRHHQLRLLKGSATAAPTAEFGLPAVPSAGNTTNATDAAQLAAGTMPRPEIDIESVLRPEIILAPLENCKAGNATTTLLVLEPGAFIPARDYVKLATAVQKAAKDQVRLIVGIVDIDWVALTPALFGGNQSLLPLADAGIKRVLQQTDKWLAPLLTNLTARRDDMFVAGHSLMGLNVINAALERAGGLILLGSMMLPEVTNTFPTASTWTRPILNLDGELDGQQLPSRQAFAAVEAADNAARLGLNYVAAFQPVILIPGMTHQQFGGGKERLIFPGQQPADLQPDISYDAATHAAGGVMAHFLAAHRAAGAQDKQAATVALQRRVLQSSCIVGPLMKAAGRGDIQRLLTRLERDPYTPRPKAARAAGLVPWAFGGEVQPSGNGKWLAHPGEAANAEAFAVKMQRRILKQLPAGMRQRVIVAATVHTDATVFLYAQATVETIPDARVLLRCHVYLWRHFLETSARVQAAIDPEYALKLKTPSIVARALGEDAEAEKQLNPCVDAAAINERILRDALESVPEATQERYKRRGKKWSTEQRTVTDAKQWLQQEHVTFTDTSANATKVSAPYHCDQKQGEAAPKLPDYVSDPGSIKGVIYFKVLSPARAIEWIMVDALRPKQQQPRPQLTATPPIK